VLAVATVRAAAARPNGADGRRSAMGSPKLAGAPRGVTACIGPLEPGGQDHGDMGSLGYMQEASGSGSRPRFSPRRQRTSWLAALQRPQPRCRMLIERKRRGRYAARIARREAVVSPAGYERVRRGGARLYRQVPKALPRKSTETSEAHGSTSTYVGDDFRSSRAGRPKAVPYVPIDSPSRSDCVFVRTEVQRNIRPQPAGIESWRGVGNPCRSAAATAD